MKNREKILGMISLTAGILFLAVMIFNSVMAVKGLSEEYQKVINYNGTEEVILSLSYDDGFYGSVGFGMTPEVGRQSLMTEVSLFARNWADFRTKTAGWFRSENLDTPARAKAR